VEATMASRLLEASEAAEARVEDIELEAAASKQDLVVLLAEEASASLEAQAQEAEDSALASSRQLGEEVQAEAAAATLAAQRAQAVAAESAALTAALRREELAREVATSELSVSRREFENWRDEFEELVCGKASATVEECVAEVRVEELFKRNELESALLAKATEERAAALSAAAQGQQARLAELEDRASASESAAGCLEAEVQKLKHEYEAQTAELNAAARESLGQRLQIEEFRREAARREEERPVGKQSNGQDEGERPLFMSLRRRPSRLPSGSNSGCHGFFDLACCYRRPAHGGSDAAR